MFTVQGYLDGISYTVQVGVDRRRANDGVVAGNPRVIGLLQSREGLPMSVGVGRRAITGTNENPEWVLACLHAETQVTDVDGETIPDLSGRRHRPGAVY
jgi:hypothetical protein